MLMGTREKKLQSILIIKETAQGELSRHRVGVGNIWVRDFEVDGDTISLISAFLGILNLDSGVEWQEIVHAGSVVVLGNDHYEITAIDTGDGETGSVTFNPLIP